ncbi:SUN domain-containing protein 3 isoform X2 [Choloepus didactylus]|uniref:SUN domain-containing protein 3 isoform X2 n=1 Tax=Choloepus didactylus TaxID=27675 RepID=UPI0018A0FD98|nr:SUN domain-containing protein 3 isoform X2 [Choloepus didactylus]
MRQTISQVKILLMGRGYLQDVHTRRNGLVLRLQKYVWLEETDFPQNSRRLHAVIAEYGSRLYNYQAKLRMPKEQLEFLKKESQTLENNFREILLLIEQIDALKALLRDMKEGMHNHSWNAIEDPAEEENKEEILSEEMSNLVNYVLKKLREDQVQMADYALKSAGASIIEAGTSESYKNAKAKLYWHGIGFLNYEMPPDIILQGISKECEGEEIFLGQFIYNKGGTTVQTFELQHEVSEYLLCVKLKILSNWGHPTYTCLYRFRVHGNPGNHT